MIDPYIKLYTSAPLDDRFVGWNDGFATYTRGLLYSGVQLTNGFVPKGMLGILSGGAKRPEQIAKRLVDEGLWVAVPGGWTVGEARWANRQTTSDQVEASREASKIRQARFKENERRKRLGLPLLKPGEDVTVTRDKRESNGVTNALLTRTQNAQIETETETEEVLERERVRANGKWVPPTLAEIELAMRVAGIPDAPQQAEGFMAHYGVTGFLYGPHRLPMVDWKLKIPQWRTTAQARRAKEKTESGSKPNFSDVVAVKGGRGE